MTEILTAGQLRARHLALEVRGEKWRACALVPASPRSRPVTSSIGRDTRLPWRPSPLHLGGRRRPWTRKPAVLLNFQRTNGFYEPLVKPFQPLVEPFEGLVDFNEPLVEPFESPEKAFEPLVEPFEPLVELFEPLIGPSRGSSNLFRVSRSLSSFSSDLSRASLNPLSLSSGSTRGSLPLTRLSLNPMNDRKREMRLFLMQAAL